MAERNPIRGIERAVAIRLKFILVRQTTGASSIRGENDPALKLDRVDPGSTRNI